MNILKQKKATWVSLLVAPVLLAGLLLVLAGNSSDATGKQETIGGFSILDGSSSVETKGLSADMESLVATSLSMSSGSGENSNVSDSSAWGETVTRSGKRVVVLRNGKQICFVAAPKGPANCGNEDFVKAEGLFVATPGSCSSVAVLGLVPDGTDELLVRGAGKSESSIAVESNVYDTVLPKETTSLVSPDGTLETPLPAAWYASQSSDCR